MVKYCTLFTTFFKIGAFTIGGGYAMIPLIQREVVERHRWMDDGDFLDSLAVAQTMPGILAANIAALVGQRLLGTRGALLAVFATILSPVLSILLISILFSRFAHLAPVQHVMFALRPAVVALIAASVVVLARRSHLAWRNCWIPLLACLLIVLLGVSPVLILLAAIAGSCLYTKLSPKKH